MTTGTRSVVLWAALWVAAVSSLLPPEGVAEAATPGGAGRIAASGGQKGLYRGTDLFVMNADGRVLTIITTTESSEGQPAWSPDGAHLAYSEVLCDETACRGRIVVMGILDLEPRAVTPGRTEVDSDPVWSPDGRWIAFTRTRCRPSCRSTIMAASRDGTIVRRMTSGEHDHDPAWSPDGRLVAFARRGHLWTVRPDGTGERDLTPGLTGPALDTPSWSPDGTKIAVTRCEGTACSVWVITSNVRRGWPVAEGVGEDAHPAWSPEGTDLVYRGPDGIYRVDLTGSSNVRIRGDDRVQLTFPDWQPIPCTITGTEGPDELTGTAGTDFICGLGGDDEIHGGGGNDLVIGGAGDDELRGGEGQDQLIGQAGADVMLGGSGTDRLNGMDLDGADLMHGGGGFDICQGDGLDAIDDTCES